MKSNLLKLFIAVIGFTFGLSSICLAQTTNSIPRNVFLTDDGRVFWYKQGKRLVDLKKIKEAKDSLESRPADQDPDGNWGVATNGFQLSLRFEKLAFTNNEPVVATLLLRNVTNSPLRFLRSFVSHQPSPINVLAFKNNKHLSRIGDDGIVEVISASEITIYPQTQCKYKVRLNDYYVLTDGGEFVFRAECGNQCGSASQNVRIRIQ